MNSLTIETVESLQAVELKPLTKRQQEIFDFIVECIANNGAPPTRVEIAEYFGFKSANAAEDHLKIKRRIKSEPRTRQHLNRRCK